MAMITIDSVDKDKVLRAAAAKGMETHVEARDQHHQVIRTVLRHNGHTVAWMTKKPGDFSGYDLVIDNGWFSYHHVAEFLIHYGQA